MKTSSQDLCLIVIQSQLELLKKIKKEQLME